MKIVLAIVPLLISLMSLIVANSNADAKAACCYSHGIEILCPAMAARIDAKAEQIILDRCPTCRRSCVHSAIASWRANEGSDTVAETVSAAWPNARICP